MTKRRTIICFCMLYALFCMAGCGKENIENKELSSNESQQESQQESKISAETSISVDFINEYLALFAAAKDENDYDKKWLGGMNARIKEINAPKDRTLTYIGEAMQLEFQFDISWDTTFGFFVYINGIPQKYYTNMSEEELYIHSVEHNKEEETSISIYVKPSIGKSGEELDLLVVPIWGVSYRPLGAHDSMYPNLEAGEFKYPFKVKMQADGTGADIADITQIDTSVKYTEYELSKLIHTMPNENKLENPSFHDTLYQYAIEDNRLRLFTGFGGGNEDGEYIVSAYFNSRLLKSYKVSPKKGYNSRVIIDDEFVFTQELLKEYDVLDYNSFYFIAVPVNSKINGGQQVQSTKGIVVSGKEVLQ